MSSERLRFRPGRDGSPVSRLPSGKIVLPERGWTPDCGVQIRCNLVEKERVVIASPHAPSALQREVEEFNARGREKAAEWSERIKAFLADYPGRPANPPGVEVEIRRCANDDVTGRREDSGVAYYDTWVEKELHVSQALYDAWLEEWTAWCAGIEAQPAIQAISAEIAVFAGAQSRLAARTLAEREADGPYFFPFKGFPSCNMARWFGGWESSPPGGLRGHPYSAVKVQQ